MRDKIGVSFLVAALAAGCGEEAAEPAARGPAPGPGDVVKVEPGKADTSAEAVFLDFVFEGEVLTDSSWRPEAQIEDQLLYTIGHLNGERSVGRLDKLELTDVRTEETEDGRTLIRYDAKLLVAWGKRNRVPETYTFRLPRDISYTGQKDFTEKYGHDCVDYGAHDVTPGSMWYYYRPDAYRCELDDADVVKLTATVSVSAVNTTGKYPEYHRIWEDGVFNVVAVFGKYEDGATTSADAGIAGYDRFHRALSGLLEQYGLETAPADVPNAPGVEMPEIIYRAKIDDGHRIVVTAILVDNVRTAGPAFDARYAELSTDADLIVYNGHAGLGANIRALASKGRWKRGQYVMVFMNGCDTYAYVDSALFDAHAEVNPDDPRGTRYTDIITNAMPSFFSSMAGATMALVEGILSYEAPRTYEQIFRDVDSSQVVLVSGEDDNEFVPGFDGGDDEPPAAWEGVSLAGALARGDEDRHETPKLPAGAYVFSMTGTGDADLYVRVGEAPTTRLFDCRPYKAGSDEACRVDLPAPATIHVMVRGYSAESTYELIGRPE